MSHTCQEFIFEAIQLQGIAEVLTRNAWRSQPPVGSWEQRELAPRKLHGPVTMLRSPQLPSDTISESPGHLYAARAPRGIAASVLFLVENIDV